MNTELFKALKILEDEHEIPMNFMIDKIKRSITIACKKSYDNENVEVNFDIENENFEVFLIKNVVDESPIDENHEILLEEAQKIDKNAEVGESVKVPLDTKEFGRIAAQTARSVIRQGIREGERDAIREKFHGKIGEIITVKIEKIDEETGTLQLRMGDIELTLPKSEQIGNENFHEDDLVKVCVLGLAETQKGPKVLISRSKPEFLKKLFEQEVPEIAQNIVEIKSIVREAGSRSKVAVLSHDDKVTPVGACMGASNMRISNILNEIGNERIDVVEYSDIPEKFIESALSPARIIEVKIDEDDERLCHVKVANEKISLAIGKGGQNVRLAAKLTGYKIDIQPQHPLFNPIDF